MHNIKSRLSSFKNSGNLYPVIGVIVALILVSLVLVLILGSGTKHGVGGYVGGLFLVMKHNFGFWILLIIAAGFGVYRKVSNPTEFSGLELGIQIGVTTLSLIILYSIFFSTSAKLSDTEIWNGYVEKAEYYEKWTEKVTKQECTSRDKNGNCKSYRTVTSYVHHPPHWEGETSCGNINLTQSQYRAYVRQFGGEREENLVRMSQSSIGDGNKFYVVCPQGKESLLPASQEHSYINYLKASDSIKKVQGTLAGYKNLIQEYPEVHSGTFGPIEIDRVIVADASVPGKWKIELDATLDRELAHLGVQKEVNVLVYAVKTADQGFSHALEEAWIKGKKNDVIVILGITDFPKVEFAYVMAWTKVEEFKIGLRNRILEMDISDGNAFALAITDEINKPAEQGGFVRMSMSELEYLASEISLPWWCQILIVILGGASSWFTSKLMIEKDLF